MTPVYRPWLYPFCSHCSQTIRHVVADVNIAGGAGGAFHLFDSGVTLVNGSYTSNEAGHFGGALFISGRLPATGGGGANSVTNSTFVLNTITAPTGGAGAALYCDNTLATFTPYVPSGSAFCDTTCVTPAGVCACAACKDVPTSAPTGAPTEAPSSSPWPWLAPLLILIVVLIAGAVWYYRRRGSSNRAKFLNI